MKILYYYTPTVHFKEGRSISHVIDVVTAISSFHFSTSQKAPDLQSVAEQK